MQAQRVRRLFATSAAGLLLAGGVAIGAAGTASAATPSHAPGQASSQAPSHNRYCYDYAGYGRWWNNGNCDYSFGYSGWNNWNNWNNWGNWNGYNNWGNWNGYNNWGNWGNGYGGWGGYR